ncbi:MAG: 50S ribosomal protein L10 [Patescibacteria group bacterium]|jgi:large subunit ribosomal protein L10
MPKTKVQKAGVIEELTQALKQSTNSVVTDFNKLTMVDLDSFRKAARAKGLKYTVVKPTLVQIAAKQADIDGDLSLNKTGKSYGLVWGNADEVSVSKLAYEFAKKSDDRVHIALGIIDGKIVPANMIMQLAMLPSYEELMGRVVGSMNAPIANFVYGINYNLQSFYNVIKAVASK